MAEERMTVEELFEHEKLMHGLPVTFVDGFVLDGTLTLVVYDTESITPDDRTLHTRRWVVCGEDGSKGGGIAKMWWS